METEMTESEVRAAWDRLEEKLKNGSEDEKAFIVAVLELMQSHTEC